MLFHPPIPIISDRLPWERPLIPVCFVRGEWTDDETRTIRDAADAAWGRFTAVGFSEWTSCDDAALDEGAARVELRRVTGCDRTLAQMPRTGFPGRGAVLPIELCLSYRDKKRVRHDTDAALLAAISVHVFGHVLGFEDATHDVVSTDAMMEGITLRRVSELSIGQRHSTLHAEYGGKPAYSLVHRGGRCLSALSGGVVAQRVCDGAVDQAWRLAGGRIAHVATNQCLRATGGTSVGLGSCTGAETWTPASVEWRAQGGNCVGVRTNPDPNAPLGRESCSASRAADQRWRFEFLADDKVRIRLARDGRCVLRPENWSYPTTARLGACDGARDIFEIRSGRLEMSGRCLNASTPLSFVACSDNPVERFAISGMFQNDLGALTLEDANRLELSSSPIASSPEQTFDYQL
jgi:hypothetical protein